MRAAATEICWPSTARTAISVPSTQPGTRSPGRAATSGASSGSLASTAATATGSASRSSSRRQRATATPRSRTSREPQRALHAAVARRQLDDRGAVRQAQRAPVGAGGRRLLDARDGARARRTRTARRSRSARGRAGAARSTRRRPRSALPRRRRSSRGVSANTSRTVSLNWRTLAKPAANATSAKPSSVVSISVRAVCARCARASASGPAPSSDGDEPVELAHAVAEPRGEPGDALAVDDAVADQPHRARDDVGARVPLGRAGRGIGAAALAGPEAGALRRRRAAVEAHVRALRRDRRAARAAVDAGRGDAEVDPAVEAVVAALDRPVPVLARRLHRCSMPGGLAEIGQRRSGAPERAERALRALRQRPPRPTGTRPRRGSARGSARARPGRA